MLGCVSQDTAWLLHFFRLWATWSRWPRWAARRGQDCRHIRGSKRRVAWKASVALKPWSVLSMAHEMSVPFISYKVQVAVQGTRYMSLMCVVEDKFNRCCMRGQKQACLSAHSR
ncbi:unnamed protein product [Ostreobium quekettii]|uniref:Secreted protein n=1 Tax=Ostreobium quekettii TaxID=121088 RepID=A0A8S1INU3_9CHLO|nr:unnamed protein product [Ostreobium quekettii]